MARPKHPEDEGIPPSDDPVPNRPSDDDEQQPPLPGDRPYGAEDRVTIGEQRRGESLRTRVAREIPDVSEQTSDRSENPPPVGRLHEPTEDGADVVAELVAEETGDDVGLTAEEAAMSAREPDESTPDEPSEAESRSD
jgi:hypothetical protein